MGILSRTGLAPTFTKKMTIKKKIEKVDLNAHVGPAPFVYKPFAAIYNPYPNSCSLLCNHPANDDVRKLLKKAKDSYVLDGKSSFLAQEVATVVRDQLKHTRAIKTKSPRHYVCGDIESVPEELFRRYTETDSRPLTPVPTFVSGHSRARVSRRCVTPDPIRSSAVQEKTLLILDLRRSHSQETMSWQVDSVLPPPPPPLISIQSVPSTRPGSPISRAQSHMPPDMSSRRNPTTSPTLRRRPKSDTGKYENTKSHLEVPKQPDIAEEKMEQGTADDEDVAVKRRGKKKKSKVRDSSRGPSAFQSVDPETQIATLGPDSHNPSARPSLVAAATTAAALTDGLCDEQHDDAKHRNSLDVDSYLDVDILRQLRRELNEETVNNEFNFKRRKALEEVMRAISVPPKNALLTTLQKEIDLPAVDLNLLLSLPRIFHRSSARFELPMDSRTLAAMTPMDYIKSNISASSARKQLYNIIFDGQLEENEDGRKERKLLGLKIPDALHKMMGKALSEVQMHTFRNLVAWKDDDVFDFKTFCGLCALCERLLAPEYCRNMPSKILDPCQEIETVDFESLTRRLDGHTIDQRLITMLYAIRDS